MTINAVYKGGAFVPTQPVTFAEGTTVTLNVEVLPADTVTQMTEEEFSRRLTGCKTFHDFVEFTKTFPPDDGSYDILERLRENRILSGEVVPPREHAA